MIRPSLWTRRGAPRQSGVRCGMLLCGALLCGASPTLAGPNPASPTQTPSEHTVSIEDPTVVSRSWGTPTVWVVSARALEAQAGAATWLDTQAAYTTFEALGAAWPDLHRRVPLVRLASALAALHGRKVALDTTLRDLTAELARAGDGTFRAERFDHRLHAPAAATLQPPTLEGDVLTAFELAEPEEVWTDTRHVTVRGFRVTYRLAATGWTSAVEALPVVASLLDQQAAGAAARFGGPVAGFWQVPLGVAALLVAHGVGAGAAPFLWSSGGVDTPYPDWSALVAAHPEAARPEALAALGAALLRDLSEASLTPIADPQSWRTTWEAQHRDVVGRHYNAGRRWETITRHTLSSPDRLQPPSVGADEVLTLVATSRALQPKGVRVSLRNLQLDTPVAVEALTTSQVISDGHEGPSQAPGPPPAGPRPQPGRPRQSPASGPQR